MKKLQFYIIIIISTTLLNFCTDSIVESVETIEEKNNNIEVLATFSDIQENIFDRSCAFSGCHISGSVSPDLSGNSYSRIVNQSSSIGMNYITPNNPDQSYILQKIIGSNIISGNIMPLNSSQLSSEKIDSIIEWIDDGAKNN